MTNIQIITVENTDGTTTEHVIIDWGNEQFSSMTKAQYDKEYLSEPTES
jgi:hypothetical protein